MWAGVQSLIREIRIIPKLRIFPKFGGCHLFFLFFFAPFSSLRSRRFQGKKLHFRHIQAAQLEKAHFYFDFLEFLLA